MKIKTWLGSAIVAVSITLSGIATQAQQAGGTLVMADWLVVLACLGVSWSIRNGLMLSLSPNLTRLYPFSTYLQLGRLVLYFSITPVSCHASASCAAFILQCAQSESMLRRPRSVQPSL